jgi:HD-GYP domain-containing protein (c-di-GMP phosphodiesterase class II)/Tfp pilus assembly protein PilZ
VVLLCALLVASSEKKELKASLENTADSTDKLIDQIDSNYNNAIMTNEIGQILSSCTNRNEIVALVVKIMENRLDFDRGLIFLANPERDRLMLQGGYGYSPEQRDLLNSVFFHLDRPSSKGVFVVSFKEQRPFLINDLNEIEDNLSPQSLKFVKKMGTRSFICCPIISEEQSVGLLAVDNVKTKRTLVESDISRLMGIASVIGISLRNAELIEAKQRQFNSLLQVLAASIDARDTLTAGHSEKVTEYSVGICNQLDLPREEREMIRVASLLHDYGKIGVPDAILKKEGRLTADEYEIVMTHAEKTREILSRVTFEGIYGRIPEIAGAHHEKVDGSGYPQGLTGENIPLGARIIAVADYFEAITAKRHYRDPMPTNYALQLVREASGTLFDERVVEAFMTYFSETRQSDPATPDGQEQRSGIQQSPRIPNRVPVAVRLGEKTVTAISEDISLHGVFVATDEEVRKGLTVELSIILADNTPEVEATGRVAWVNSRDALSKPSFPAGFGVEILEFRDMTERILESFLSSVISAGYPQGEH